MIKYDILDFDSTLEYVFLVYLLFANHINFDTYLLLLVLYCTFINLMTDSSSTSRIKTLPKTACIIIAVSPYKDIVKAIIFGTFIQLNKKTKL